MPSYKTEGIVIRRMNFGEADRILTILSERFGKIKAIAKGVRKTKSHMGGSLEPFMLLELQLHEGKTFYIVTGTIINEEFPHLHQDLNKMSRAYYVGELIDRFSQEHQRSPEIFQICLESLRLIEKNDSEFMLRVFELKIIEASGFHPELYDCVHCKEKLTPDDNFWDAVEGGVVCEKCQKTYHHGIKISDETIKFFRFVENNSIDQIKRLNVSKEVQKEADEILGNYIKNILERDLKTIGFLKNCAK